MEHQPSPLWNPTPIASFSASDHPASAVRPVPVHYRHTSKIHYTELGKYLVSYLAATPPNSRTNSRLKLSQLTTQQFHELSTDVYDELIRRNKEIGVRFLPVRGVLPPERNQTRQKLSKISTTKFRDLSCDVHFELARRYPEFKQEASHLQYLRGNQMSGLNAQLKGVETGNAFASGSRGGDDLYYKYGRPSVNSIRSTGGTGSHLLNRGVSISEDKKKMRRDYDYQIPAVQIRLKIPLPIPSSSMAVKKVAVKKEGHGHHAMWGPYDLKTPSVESADAGRMDPELSTSRKKTNSVKEERVSGKKRDPTPSTTRFESTFYLLDRFETHLYSQRTISGGVTSTASPQLSPSQRSIALPTPPSLFLAREKDRDYYRKRHSYHEGPTSGETIPEPFSSEDETAREQRLSDSQRLSLRLIPFGFSHSSHALESGFPDLNLTKSKSPPFLTDSSSLRISGRGSNETLSESTTHPLIKITEEEIIGKTFLIGPISPSRAEENPFAYAQLNDLSGQVHKECPIGGGSFADVYMGNWINGTTSMKVAIKVLRSHIYGPANIPKLEKRLKREMRIWGNLDHPNIVSLLGVASDLGQSTAMVCQWMSQGTLSDYLEKEKENLNLQERLKICITIAAGLSYLHSQKVIHGDLTPANVLMDNDTAHLSDFGLSNVIDELQGPSFFTSKAGGSARWTAPEISQGSDLLTTSCDVYSFASVAFYVITGMLPYWHLKSEHEITIEIFKSSDKFPSRPAQSLLTDECWEILMMCWAVDPTKRLGIDDVKHRLQQLKFP